MHPSCAQETAGVDVFNPFKFQQGQLLLLVRSPFLVLGGLFRPRIRTSVVCHHAASLGLNGDFLPRRPPPPPYRSLPHGAELSRPH